MKREELLRERLKRYSASETAAFHMPGHKRYMEYGLLLILRKLTDLTICIIRRGF